MSHVHDVVAADPAVQQAGRAVKRPAGGRRTVIPDYEMKTPWAAWQWPLCKGKPPCHFVLSSGNRRIQASRRDSIQISQIWRVQVMTCT